MDSQIDVESVRARYRAVPYTEAMRIAVEVGVSPSTAQKFRMGHIEEVGASKLAKISNALVNREGEQAKPSDQPAPNGA
jgi:hypothetical protein